MLYTNAELFRAEGVFRRGSFRVENGLFTQITDELFPNADVDLGGKCVIPGVVDIHTHGNSGYDFSNGEEGCMEAMTRWWAQNGVTSALPTSMTVSVEMLERAFVMADSFRKSRPAGCARVMGVNMEGPFFSYNKRGAQNPAYLLDPDIEVLRRLQAVSDGIVKLVDIAPELPGSLAFIDEASKLCTVSIGHSDADYEQAAAAIAHGVTHLTHLFNAMQGIHHRKPGPIAAGSENDGVYAELICDGMHVQPAVMRMAFRLFPGRVCIISDSLSCCGLPEGQYESGGLRVFLRDGLCHLEDGTIAGSVCSAYQGMRNCIAFGIPREEAILAATRNPAHQAGCLDTVGTIEEGKYADFVVCDAELAIDSVFIGGERI